ncbi:MAG TPA: ABC transporter permease [Caldilineaceae bacterium]|nr:ABC transporter permease [Caldilineaceae bacterium]
MLYGQNAFYGLTSTLRVLSYNRVGFVGFLCVVLIVVLSYIGPIFWPPETIADMTKIFAPPSAEHWLGTDDTGKDIWRQIVNGGREVIYAAAVAAVISTLIAVVFGALSGFVGRGVDTVIMTITDIFLTIPTFPLLAVLATFIKLNNVAFLGILLGLLGWPALLRAVRAQTLSLKERDFVEAARALDLGTRHILFREMIPNMMTYIIISFTLAFTGAIYGQVGLILLGLAPFSTSNWSLMISWGWNHGMMFFKNSIWYIMSPIVAIALLQLAVITMARSLELVFNPRLRSGG